MFTLHLGDCLEAMKSLPDGSIDLVATDPPYGTTNLEFDKVRIDWPAWWEQIHRVAKPSAIIAVFAAQPFTTDMINSNRKNFRYDLVWQKTNAVGFLDANVRPLRAHESVLIFCRRFGRRRVGQHRVLQSIYNPQMTAGTAYTQRGGTKRAAHYNGGGKDLGKRRNEGTRFPTSVMTYARDVPSRHPTAKPMGLSRYLVRTYSHEGDTVLDPFAGSGSIPLAALLEGRNAVASETDPKHIATIVRHASELGLPEPCLIHTNQMTDWTFVPI